jgi:hypothetical protein
MIIEVVWLVMFSVRVLSSVQVKVVVSVTWVVSVLVDVSFHWLHLEDEVTGGSVHI